MRVSSVMSLSSEGEQIACFFGPICLPRAENGGRRTNRMCPLEVQFTPFLYFWLQLGSRLCPDCCDVCGEVEGLAAFPVRLWLVIRLRSFERVGKRRRSTRLHRGRQFAQVTVWSGRPSIGAGSERTRRTPSLVTEISTPLKTIRPNRPRSFSMTQCRAF